MPEPRWDTEPFLEDPKVFLAVSLPEETGTHTIFSMLMVGTECWHSDDRSASEVPYLAVMDEASFRELISAGQQLLDQHDARFRIG